MGTPKQLLPWNGSTVIAVTVDNLRTAGADPVVVVVGHKASSMEAALKDAHAIAVANVDYANGELLQSFQVGLQYLSSVGDMIGTLLALGDQPHVPASVSTKIIDEANRFPSKIIIPSHDMRRGHPIFLPASLWDEVRALGADATMRSVLNRHQDIIQYVNVSTPAILIDLDTPEDYEALKPR